jgi:hypothetical protein
VNLCRRSREGHTKEVVGGEVDKEEKAAGESDEDGYVHSPQRGNEICAEI